MIPDYKNIFNESRCLTKDEMLGYLSGKITKEDKQRIEMHLADCEMCNDEIEGLSIVNDTAKLNSIVNELNHRIITAVNKQTIRLKPGHKFSIIRITAIAASAVLVIFASIYLYFISLNKADHLAEMNKGSEFNTEKDSKLYKDMIADTLNSAILEESSIDNRIESEKVIKADQIKTESGEDIFFSEVTEEELPDRNKQIDEKEDIGDIIQTDDMSGVSKEEVADGGLDRVDVDESITISNTEKDKSDRKKIIGFTSRSVPSETPNAGRESEDKYTAIKAEALFSYNEKVYQEALDSFEKYLKNQPNDIESIYKSGMCHFYLKSWSKAVEKFNLVITKGTGMYYEDAEWYKARSLIYQNNMDNAFALLKQISSRNGKYKNEAIELLKKYGQ